MDIDSTTNSSASKLTDEIHSIVSNSSGLIDYQDQEEFEKLRIINPQNYSLVEYTQSSTPKNDSGCDFQYEECVSDISHQLQSTLTMEQKYEHDLYGLEKNIKMQYHNKLENLIKSNHQIKSELTMANEQIERLLKQFSAMSGNSNLDYHFVQLEKRNYDLFLQNSVLQTKILQIKSEKDEAELQLKQLNIEISQYKIDIDTKNAVIKELKDKITKQHSEITRMSRNLYSFSHMFEETNLEFQHTKKTLEWYKQELYSFQSDKKTLLAELYNCKKDISLQKETISNLNIELENVKNRYESSQLQALREKINFFTSQKCESHVTSENEKHQPVEVMNKNSPSFNEYENIIKDLNNELLRINTFVEVQNATIEKISRENSDLLSRCIILQKSLEQKESTINGLENEKKLSKMEIEIFTNQEQERYDEYNKMKKELVNLRTELVMSKQENEIVESTVKTIRRQVSIFKLKYEALKQELSDRNKQISFLQNEKQELFMKNSWQICELEKINDRDALISSLKKEIEVKEQDVQKYSCHVEVLEDAIKKQGTSFSEVLKENQILALQNKEEIQKYDIVLQQYRELLLSSEKKVNELKKYYTVSALHQKTNQVCSNISLIDSCENLDDDLKTLMKVKFPESSHMAQLDSVKLFDESPHTVTMNTLNSYNVQNIEHKLKSKLYCLIERAKKLHEKMADCQKMVNSILSVIRSKGTTTCETIDQLRVLLQVKNLEMQEKQKKFERNNRLLLRKVKELMKAKTSAEKRYGQLQECFICLTDENRLLKSSIENQMGDTEKLKETEFKLEDEPRYTSLCQNECSENQVHKTIMENVCQNSDNDIQINEYSELTPDIIKSLEEKSFKENTTKELKDQIDILSSENQILSFSLLKKAEEIEYLEGDVSKKQINFEKKMQESRALINELKNHLNEIQNERESTDREKFFLQRICNDLKLSLKSQTNYSKVLEERLSHFSQRTINFTSLPNMLPDSCFKMYDVQHVNRLLQNKAAVQEIGLTEVRGCLKGLRKEVSTLQEQIRKNYNLE